MKLDLDEMLILHVLIHRQEEAFDDRSLTDYEKYYMVPAMREMDRKIHVVIEAERKKSAERQVRHEATHNAEWPCPSCGENAHRTRSECHSISGDGTADQYHCKACETDFQVAAEYENTL